MKTRKYAHVKDNYNESRPSNNNNNYSDERGDDNVLDGTPVLMKNFDNVPKPFESGSAPLLELKNITKEYVDDRGKKIVVLNGINLSINHHEYISIVGPSGGGKSTLLRIIMGLETCTTGEVLLKGEPLKGKVDPHMAMVFQSFGLFPWLTVVENVEFGLESNHIPKDERRKKSLNIIQEVGLEGFENAYPRELSGGMKQRVGIARALVLDPEVLLMDEPFSSLDPLTAEALREEILKVWSNRLTTPDVVIMVSHNVEEAVYLSDRVVVLSHRPAAVVKEVQIDIPRPREKRDTSIYDYTDQITTLIA
ncbi:MAG: ABC transporter ATP-binding protein [Thermoproteota archaeon]|nr:ABC transporter ATP-binding protein [Thermoproteota archaeon]